ncbi:HD domain-containing protein [Methanosarcina sp. Z-7115]|uniref:HD domain-containing protein n=1 Tax=Methanosarcina baikalica TaxID=3073890 RepID=A0ABU2CXU9_9EURY|nr:HD domain-containing protein [Methanosarcina sp. Z-7115]MDR7664511.1 HD domain-containing protein [Methanosarcina sp. Z-7115]
MHYPDEIEFKKHIFDDVHGFIGITELESKVIASSFFQRLRRIKQLSLLEYVFPGASHNRFSHSLGVMYIADNMVVQLQKDGYLKEKRKLIRMAALLHDIGHYPLSHLIESVVIKDCENRIQTDDIQVEEYSNDHRVEQNRINNNKLLHENEVHEFNFALHEPRNKSKDYAHHERIAGIVIHKTDIYDILLEDSTFSKEDIKTISQIIAGTFINNNKDPVSLIIHSELDADRFDYLLRDSKQTGVTYGVFDMDQIIRNLTYFEKDGKLVVKDKAIKAVEHYLMCRYFFYTTVIYHKATIGFELMAKKVYEGLIERKMVRSYFDLIDIFKDGSDIDEYLDYDDLYFFNTLKKINKTKVLNTVENPKIPDVFLLELIDKIIRREPLKKAIEESELIERDKFLNSSFFHPSFRRAILSKGIEDHWFIKSTISESPIKISPYVNFEALERDSNNYIIPDNIDETIKILKNYNKNETPYTEYLIKEMSSIISVLGKYKLQINRLYTKNEDYKKIIEEENSKK